ncbi:hypothetical protein D3C72_815380 [compost metagenome]
MMRTRSREGINALRNALHAAKSPDWERARALHLASRKPRTAHEGPKCPRSDYFKAYRQAKKKARCPGCGLTVSKDNLQRCIECHARTCSSPTNYLTPFEADMLELYVGAKTCREFQRFMAIRHGIYRTRQGWQKAAYNRDLKFLTHQPTVTASELARLLGVDFDRIVRRIEKGEILSIGKVGKRYLIPVEEAERLVKEGYLQRPFDDPIPMKDAARLVGYDRRYFAKLTTAGVLASWSDNRGFKYVSRAQLERLKADMAETGRTLRDYLPAEVVVALRARVRIATQNTRLRKHAASKAV